MLFNRYKREIERYCQSNNLSFEKAKELSQCWGRSDLWLQYHDPSKGKDGLRDETPAPIVLKMTVVNNTPVFEQTEYTQKYLAQ
ncbi:MAG: hypothetical protein NC215_08625 [Ruminococcus sp.]|nr:hypothetical protein [Ruminococcus sp.]